MQSDKLSTNLYLNLLIATIFIAMMSVCVFLFLFISASKNDMSMVINHRIAPVAQLEEIGAVLHINIAQTLFSMIDKAPDSAHETALLQSITELKFLIQGYKQTSEDANLSKMRIFTNKILRLEREDSPFSYFKRDISQRLFANIGEIVEQTQNLIDQKDLLNEEKMQNLMSLINYADTNINSLLNHHFKEIKNEKIRIEYLYEKSYDSLIFLICMVLFLSAAIGIGFIGNVKKTNELLNTMVERKTRELKELNENLENKLEAMLESSRKKDQTIYAQSRLASLGEMMQNVSHQWRQPLAALMMIIQSFATKSELNKLSKEFIQIQVDEALNLGKSMSQTLEDFRSFYSPKRTKFEFKISSAIDEALRLTKFRCDSESVGVRFEKDGDCMVNSFKNELVHVLINIIQNSIDALGKNSASKEIFIRLSFSANMAKISITDNGGGIDEGIMQKIFDPYFTTKHQSVGTGIGLYMSKEIISRHIQGKIKVKNVTIAPYNQIGAQFDIFVPFQGEIDAAAQS